MLEQRLHAANLAEGHRLVQRSHAVQVARVRLAPLAEQTHREPLARLGCDWRRRTRVVTGSAPPSRSACIELSGRQRRHSAATCAVARDRPRPASRPGRAGCPRAAACRLALRGAAPRHRCRRPRWGHPRGTSEPPRTTGRAWPPAPRSARVPGAPPVRGTSVHLGARGLVQASSPWQRWPQRGRCQWWQRERCQWWQRERCQWWQSARELCRQRGGRRSRACSRVSSQGGLRVAPAQREHIVKLLEGIGA